MPKALAPEKREAIAADIRAGKPRNQIARDHKVSGSTVTGIAADIGLTDAFDRSATKKATEANAADHAAVLVKLASRHASVAGDILASFEAMDLDAWASVSPHTRAIALGICSDKARELAPAEDGSQTEMAKSLLVAVLDQARARYGDES